MIELSLVAVIAAVFVPVIVVVTWCEAHLRGYEEGLKDGERIGRQFVWKGKWE